MRGQIYHVDSHQPLHGVANYTQRVPGGGLSGNIGTQYGMVTVVSRGVGQPKGFTRMRFIHKGHVYSREWDKGYRRSFLATLANRFVDDVVVTRRFTRTKTK